MKTGFWKSIEYIESEESQLYEELSSHYGKAVAILEREDFVYSLETGSREGGAVDA